MHLPLESSNHSAASTSWSADCYHDCTRVLVPLIAMQCCSKAQALQALVLESTGLTDGGPLATQRPKLSLVATQAQTLQSCPRFDVAALSAERHPSRWARTRCARSPAPLTCAARPAARDRSVQ